MTVTIQICGMPVNGYLCNNGTFSFLVGGAMKNFATLPEVVKALEES